MLQRYKKYFWSESQKNLWGRNLKGSRRIPILRNEHSSSAWITYFRKNVLHFFSTFCGCSSKLKIKVCNTLKIMYPFFSLHAWHTLASERIPLLHKAVLYLQQSTSLSTVVITNKWVISNIIIFNWTFAYIKNSVRLHFMKNQNWKIFNRYWIQ